MLEHRYERTDDVHYRLQTWYPGPNPAPTNIVVARHEDTPEWLARVLAVATVGDHLQRPTYPPPQAILWFSTTPEFDLVTISRIGVDPT